MERAGSRRSISSATSWMTAVLPLTRLAHTRLCSGRGGAGEALGAVRKQALDHLLGSAHPGGAGENSGDGGHAFLVGFLTFG